MDKVTTYECYARSIKNVERKANETDEEHSNVYGKCEVLERNIQV